MHKQRIGILVGALLGAIGAFLPWITMKAGMMSISISGTHEAIGWGWAVLILFALAVLFAVMGNKNAQLDAGRMVVSIICGLAGGAIGLWKLMQVGDIVKEAARLPGAADLASAGMGLYMIIAGGALVLILGVFLKDK